MLKRAVLPLVALFFIACGGGNDVPENDCIGPNCDVGGDTASINPLIRQARPTVMSVAILALLPTTI